MVVSLAPAPSRTERYRGSRPRQNFGTVEEDLYRSGHPNELNFPFLERLGLKTIVYLSAEEPSEALYAAPPRGATMAARC